MGSMWGFAEQSGLDCKISVDGLVKEPRFPMEEGTPEGDTRVHRETLRRGRKVAPGRRSCN